MANSPEDSTLRRLLEEFAKKNDGAPPTHFTRAPGRVNLIGEHTDYNGLPVFPMALGREIRIAFRPREDDRVVVRNLDGEFGPRSFRLSEEIPPEPTGDWGNYLKAPSQALVRLFGPLRGMDALVSSTLPVASGLSSSSAMVIALGRALLEANGQSLPVLEMAEEMARAERYTGTQGGGMDQAISLGALEGHASRIEFDPLRIFPCPVPANWRFVVAHTLNRAEKSGPAQAAYNLRTRECREALDTVGRILADGVAEGGIPGGPEQAGPGAEEEARFEGREAGGSQESDPGEGGLTYRELMELVPLPDLLQLAEDHLAEDLGKRFRHVVTEAARVYEAEQAMRRGDILTFGLLMNFSHESLRTEYEVSSPELDHLVKLAREAGAAGARLTGAGFGGCVVALTDPVRADRVMDALDRGYYRVREVAGPLDEVRFIAEPSPGASVTEL